MGLEERLQKLEDDRAIRDLKASYLRACDAKDPDSLRDTLLPIGAVIAFDGFPTFTSRDDFVSVYAQMGCAPGIFDVHHGANGIIRFESDTQAAGSWSLYFHNINLEAKTLTQMGVEYDDVYARRDGRWWIVETVSHVTSMITEQVAEDGSITVLALAEPPAA